MLGPWRNKELEELKLDLKFDEWVELFHKLYDEGDFYAQLYMLRAIITHYKDGRILAKLNLERLELAK